MFYQGKKVLVTGGTGFVGSHLVEELLRRGASVRVTVHNRPPAVAGPEVEDLSADLTQEQDCLRAFDGVDYAFHAAGFVGSAGLSRAGAVSGLSGNLILTARALEAAVAMGVKRLLIFSSSTTYPAVEHPVKEDEMWSGQVHPAYFGYGWMRRYFERLSEFAAGNSDLRVAICRPTAVYGPRDSFDPANSHVIPALIRRAVEGDDPYVVWGDGREVRDFLHVADLARGCLDLLELVPDCDPVNIGFGQGTETRQVVDQILKAADKRPQVVYDTSKPSTIPVRRVDISKARELLGFEPRISLEEGIAQTVSWFKQSLA